ncbi:MAG: hypothetical protein J5596_00085 [Bacteroidaceae bacterium]|nr:hypothetical protein [Bacteroidaceae bacterium]
MSKKISLCVLFALCSLLFIGCDEESYIVDWAPVEIIIYAEDSDGNSIIQQEMPGMTLTFQGETYTVRDWESVIEEKKTRAYLAQIYGFIAETYSEDSTAYRLYFGEIDGAADMDEDIVLTWPDGSKDTIHYHCSDHKEGKNPKCNRSWKLNGQKHSGGEFHFTGK